MKKFIFGAVLSLGLLVSPSLTQAAGLTAAQVQSILAILSSFGADSATIANVNTALGGTPTVSGQSFCHDFSNDLTVGNSGNEVLALNQALSSSGISAGSDANFNENDAADVVQFQAQYGIRQTGYVGPMTRAKLNSLYGCRNNQQPTQPTTVAPVAQPTPVAVTATSNIGFDWDMSGICVKSDQPTTSGATVHVCWRSTNVSSCTVMKAVNGGAPFLPFNWESQKAIPNAIQGGIATPGTVGSHVFTINCTGPNGATSDSVTHTVSSPEIAPTISSFSVNGNSQTTDGFVYVVNVTNPTLQWSSPNASYCKGFSSDLVTGAATSEFTGTKAASGSEQIMLGNSYYNQRTITLTCYNSSGMNSETKVAKIGGKG